MIKKYHIATLKSILQNLKNPYKTIFNLNTHTHTLVGLKNGTKFLVRNFMDLWVIGETYIKKDYQQHGCAIADNWTVIDIGADLGDFSVLAGQTSSQNKVYAIEPFLSSYKLLKKNIKLNNLNNINAFNIGLASKNGYLSIDQNQTNLGNNTSNFSQIKTSNSVRSYTLSSFLMATNMKKVDLLKSDCEGAEFDIFLNLPQKTYKKIDRIVMEYHLFNPQYHLRDLIKKLNQNGFNIKKTPNPIHKDIGFLYAYKN